MSFKYSSPPNTINNSKGINFKYYTNLQVGEYVDIPTLNGKFDVTYDGSFKSGQLIRVGMEIGDEANWFKWRDQNIFYGDVTSKKFTEAMIGKKYKIKGYELHDFRQWCLNSKTSDELVAGSWNSGIKILDNDNNKIDTSTNIATFEF